MPRHFIFTSIKYFPPTLAMGLLFLSIFSPNLVHAQTNVERTAQGIVCQCGPVRVELSVPTDGIFHLSASTDADAQPANSSFLDLSNTTRPAWEMVKQHGWIGVRSAGGELLVNPTNGEWTLKDASGQVLIPEHPLDFKQSDGATNPSISLALGWPGEKPVRVYGCGNGVNSLQQSDVKTQVGNGRAVIPYYWANAGYAVLAVTKDDNQPASWHATKDNNAVIWTFPGNSADLYLMPAPTLKAAAQKYATLTGHAPVPPLWAFGYLQSRWGWQDRAYIEDTLQKFAELKLPVDAFIYDFEWYTPAPDYSVPTQGTENFSDFDWNKKLFPEPAEQIAEYKKQGVHFIGIRKPRLGNKESLAMMRSNGWALTQKAGFKQRDGFDSRDMDFSNPGLSDWYGRQSSNLISAGVDGWWNDEGEASYTTYYYWNLTEDKAWSKYRPNQRLWTLNRAFSPGVQRLGAAAWTGDINAQWSVLAETPTSLLNWSLAGMPYEACDIGGFNGNPTPELLTRWMEAGVFFPIMRCHSSINSTPHFPWLFGTNALHDIRDALDLRYRLIPYYYSLSHETFASGVPIMRPLIMEFPDDPKVANLSSEWMMGDSLLAAPVLHKGTSRQVYLPAGDWYDFDHNTIEKGSATYHIHANLGEIPVYVRAGSILPLASILQHTSQLPGGALQLQIYPGKDATFTLFEDDGKTLDYQHGQVRRTTFNWNDATGRLTWKQDGPYDGTNVFKKVHVTLFDPQKMVKKESDLTTQSSLELRTAQ